MPAPKTSERTKSHPSLPFGEIPQFMRELRGREGIVPRALEFTVRCAARTGETLGAKWSEIDLENKIWTIPGERMKAGRQHRVPLSDRAVEIIEVLPREGDYVFIGSRAGKNLGNGALLDLMRVMRPGFVPHGLRASFKTWTAERTNFPRDVVENSLAHKNPNRTEAAYERGDLLDKRRRLMTEWARFCGSTPAQSGAEVVSIRQG
jgi:integrase